MAAATLLGSHATDSYIELEKICEQAAETILSDVLEFLEQHKIDIVVFPESHVPRSFLPKLIKFSEDRVIVAGLGTIRTDEEASQLVETCKIAERVELKDRNVSALIVGGECSVITKESQADNEHATSGEGAVVRDITVRGNQFRIGVAVCKDYLVSEKQLWDQHADIVCIPAFSSNLADFEARAPRNFARLLANTARYGGTQIMAPELDDPFTDRRGVIPIPKDRQGVIVVDFDGYKPKITGYVNPRNRLALRAEIIERTADNKSALDAIEALEIPPSGTAKEKSDQIRRLLNLLDKERPVAAALKQCLTMYCTGFDPSEFIETFVRPHLAVNEGFSRKSIRKRQVDLILETLKDLVVNKPEVTEAGEALTHYRELAGKYQMVEGATRARKNLTATPIDPESRFSYQGHVVANGTVTEQMPIPDIEEVDLEEQGLDVDDDSGEN